MLYSKNTTVALIEHRISVLKAHGEQMNLNLINALIREKKKIMKEG